jgi:membrane protease YdiL (CAAX protease family)
VKSRVLFAIMIYVLIGALLKHFVPGLGLGVYRTFSLSSAALVIAYIFHVDKWRIKQNGHGVGPLRSTLFVVGAYFLSVIATQAWFSSVQNASNGSISPSAVGGVSAEQAISIGSILMSIVIAPIREELIFRYGFQRLLQPDLRPFFAILVSAAVFTASHLGSLPLITLIPIFIGGLILGVVFQVCGIWCSIAVHILVNLQPFLRAKGIPDLDNGLVFAVYLLFAASGLFVLVTTVFKQRRRIFGVLNK